MAWTPREDTILMKYKNMAGNWVGIVECTKGELNRSALSIKVILLVVRDP